MTFTRSALNSLECGESNQGVSTKISYICYEADLEYKTLKKLTRKRLALNSFIKDDGHVNEDDLEHDDDDETVSIDRNCPTNEAWDHVLHPYPPIKKIKIAEEDSSLVPMPTSISTPCLDASMIPMPASILVPILTTTMISAPTSPLTTAMIPMPASILSTRPVVPVSLLKQTRTRGKNPDTKKSILMSLKLNNAVIAHLKSSIAKDKEMIKSYLAKNAELRHSV